MFKTTKDECRKQLAAEKFEIVERNGRADYLRSYNSIVTENGIETNIVQCNFCGRLDEYDTEKGTRSLGVHATKCNGTNQSKLLTSYFEKNFQIRKEEKRLSAMLQRNFASETCAHSTLLKEMDC